nr:hypothetical protein Iba_chr01aCG11050 [Ipomoea batatas]
MKCGNERVEGGYVQYLTDVAINEYVAAIEISMNYTWFMITQVPRSAHFCDEIQHGTLLVCPHRIQCNYVLILQRLQKANLRKQPVKRWLIINEVAQLHLVPCHFNPLFLIKRSVHFFHSSTP